MRYTSYTLEYFDHGRGPCVPAPCAGESFLDRATAVDAYCRARAAGLGVGCIARRADGFGRHMTLDLRPTIRR